MTAKRIAILGSTGSIGRQAMEIVAREKSFHACALAAGRNWELLARQAKSAGAELAAIADAACSPKLAEAIPAGVELLAGDGAMVEMVRRARADLVLTAVVGSAGLAPTLAAIECGADLAIANKETLVMAGAIVMPAAERAGVRVLPVDSEHSAISQCLAGQRCRDVRRIILTASGGPFRTASAEQVRNATLRDALNHPTWDMGPKVTIDSATLMNKALEVIEAHWLFGLPAERIEVVVHPESLVHGFVEFCDGSVLAQMGPPSMATPIAYALFHPDRAPQPAAPLDVPTLGSLHFEPVDPDRFPAVGLGYEVIRRGGTSGATLNAANESAVAAFVAGRIEFGRIVEIVREVLNQAPATVEVTMETILDADSQARRQVEALVRGAPSSAGAAARSKA